MLCFDRLMACNLNISCLTISYLVLSYVAYLDLSAARFFFCEASTTQNVTNAIQKLRSDLQHVVFAKRGKQAKQTMNQQKTQCSMPLKVYDEQAQVFPRVTGPLPLAF